MVKRTKSILTNISAAELKKMLAAKEKIEDLESSRKGLLVDLAKIDREIEKFLSGKATGAPRKKAAKKKTAKKMAKKTAKKTAKKVVKKAAKKKVGKAPRKKAATGVRLEDVIIKVIKAAGKEMSFPDIKATITSQKLYKSKSKNFDNVLRRTISTAKGIKRVRRGVYAAK